MPWVKIDDQAPEHAKQLQAGPVACWLWVCGLAWCNRHLTDGRIPHSVVTALLAGFDTVSLAQQLHDVGLWERRDDGYVVHDYGKYQPRASTVRRRQAQSRERLRRWRKQRAGNARETPLQTHMKRACNALPVPVPSTEVRDVQHDSLVAVSKSQDRTVNSISLVGANGDNFAAFWSRYPRKVGRKKALETWKKLRPSAELVDRMLRTLEWQVRTAKWLEAGGQYIPHPTTWLNEGRWDDEPVGLPNLTGKNARMAADLLVPKGEVDDDMPF
jgi:hypothetical protein